MKGLSGCILAGNPPRFSGRFQDVCMNLKIFQCHWVDFYSESCFTEYNYARLENYLGKVLHVSSGILGKYCLSTTFFGKPLFNGGQN